MQQRKSYVKVSVIMNVFNGEKFINKSVQSVIDQSFKNWELVIWDNNSNDETSLICESFTDKRIRYLKSDLFESLYSARNKAISNSCGELITFLDVDDFWLSHKLKSQVELMTNKQLDFCYSNYFVVSEKENKKKSRKAFFNKLPSGKIYEDLLKSYRVGILTLCFRREVLAKYNISFDSRFSMIGDMVFVLELSKFGKGHADQSCLACYRSHDNNLSKSKKSLQVREMRIWFNDLRRNGEFNKYKLSSLISLTNYQRAISLVPRLKFRQLIKISLSINNFYLVARLIAYFFYKSFFNKFIYKK